MPSPLSLFVACAPGLEPLLADEVRGLGLDEAARETAGGVELGGDVTAVWRANLELGLASRVLLRVGEVRAKRLPELVRKASRLSWGQWLLSGVPFRVHATSRASRLYHTGAIAERVERGIADVLGSAPLSAGHGPSPEGDLPDPVVVHARFVRDVCTLSIDTSGEPLHRRGYRLATAKAPLREDLARALVIASGWDRASPLVDPMMGSGTIAIEAAQLARRLPPGRLRERFGFMRLPGFDRAAYEAVRARAMETAAPALPFPVHGRDRDAGAVEAARANAERAGVRQDLDLRCAPLGRALWPDGDAPPVGAVVTNPPHGRRIGGRRGLASLHQRFGDLARALPPGWRIALLGSDRRLLLRTGLDLRTAALTDQGGTKVRLMVTGPPHTEPNPGVS